MMALTRKEFETIGRVVARQAEISTIRNRAAQATDAVGTAEWAALRGFQCWDHVDQRRKDQVGRLLRRHLKARLVARNGGWRPLRPRSVLARELERAAKKARIEQHAQRAIQRVTA
jgi:hypothetical protein